MFLKFQKDLRRFCRRCGEITGRVRSNSRKNVKEEMWRNCAEI